MIKLSDYVFSFLEKKGIKHIFMLSGGGAMHLVDSIGRNKNIHYICTRHEQAASMAAEGYYRASARMAGVLVTSGPGGTNTITGVIGQWLDSIPCIYISGQVKRETTISACPELTLRQLGDQEINIVDIVKPVTKYAVMVQDAQKIKYHLEKAVYLATHGRPGPVWLDMPLDIQAAEIEPSKLPGYDEKEDSIAFDEELIKKQVRELLSRIKKAKKPVLMAGYGIRIAGAEKIFLQLVQKLNIPVITAICGHDLIWSDHPLFFGRPGICGDRWSNFIQQNSDLFLAVGARLGVRQVGYSYSAFAREAYRAMVDIDQAELNKPTLYLDMKVHAHAKFFIEQMLREIGDDRLRPKEQWLSWCRERKATLPDILQDNVSNGQYVNSYVFVDELFKLLEPGSQVVTGNGTAYTGTFQIMNLKKDCRVFTNQGCASMGYDIPAAIGACFGRNKGSVILITGDGSIQMNIQELETVICNKLPIKIFVLNNSGYLAIRITQDTYFNSRYVASSPKDGVTCPDLCRVAEAYGLKTAKIFDEENISNKINDVLNMDGPVLCEVSMIPNQTLYPKISSERKPDGTLVSKPLEDMYPFLQREEFKNNMIIKPWINQ